MMLIFIFKCVLVGKINKIVIFKIVDMRKLNISLVMGNGKIDLICDIEFLESLFRKW